MAMWCVCLRGEVLAGAVISDDIMQGVVRLCEGGWYDPDENGLCKYGSANVLTLDQVLNLLMEIALTQDLSILKSSRANYQK